MSSRFLVANPGCGEFAQQVALSLYETDRLEAYATTFAANVSWGGVLASERGAGFDNPITRQLRRRRIDLLPVEKVSSWPALEMLRVAVNRVDKRGVAADWMWERAEKYFAAQVARELRRRNCGVYGYEYSSLEPFLAAAESDLPRVYDVPSLEHGYVQQLIRAEVAACDELADAYFERTESHENERSQRRRDEWQLASFVIANSEVTRRSYERAGRDVSKVYVVPLAAPPIVPPSGDERTGGPLRFIYAGTVSIRKGCHYLLRAWRSLDPGKTARLDLFGASQIADKVLDDGVTGACWHGSVAHETLREHYRNSDVLVFPSLCDGFGLVVTEALAHGLPVITTNEAGASMLITHRHNGLIVPARDSTALCEAMAWCLNNRDALREMKRAALETAAGWQWRDYRQRFTQTFARAMAAHC